ncbi:MAG: glutamate ligase domain-containing protein, partial [Bradymonadaceae bacterium]
VEAVEFVFRRLVEMIPESGSLWVNGDDPRVLAVSTPSKALRKTFGLGEGNDLRATNIEDHDSFTRFEVTYDGKALGCVDLPTIGDFNVRNALGAMALAMDEGVDFETIRSALSRFVTTKKRQELIGTVADIAVYDDFAHHPTAVQATLEALRGRVGERRIWAIFEAKSNTSRRRVFQDQYPAAFAPANRVILSKPWRKDEDLPSEELLDIDELAASIRALGPTTELIPEVDAIVAHVVSQAEPGDVIVGLSGAAFGGLHNKLISALKVRFETAPAAN